MIETDPIINIVLCLLFTFDSLILILACLISYFFFLFISQPITFTIFKNSSWVKIPFSTTSLVWPRKLKFFEYSEDRLFILKTISLNFWKPSKSRQQIHFF
jgi:hypothetical protein